MKHETSTALYEYWQSCHADSAVRAGIINAVELAPLLPDIFLVDLDPNADSLFRFCGVAVSTRYGRDLAGESFLALWNPDDREALERDLRVMASRSSGLVAGIMGETMGGGFIAYEMLLLPLVGARGGAGVLGSMVRIGGHDEHNRIRGRIISQSLRSIRFLPASAPGSGWARSAAVEALPHMHAQSARRYRHLTVVSGGK